jgi:hypothetical protein
MPGRRSNGGFDIGQKKIFRCFKKNTQVGYSRLETQKAGRV